MKQYLILFFVALASLTCQAATFKISPQVQIESLTLIDPLELWSARVPVSIELGEVDVNYRMLDPEAAIHRGIWRLCGLVMIGNGDLATRPIVFRVWTGRPCDLVVSIDGESRSANSARMKIFRDSAEVLIIHTQGAEVIVSGISIGQIRFGNTVR